MSDIVYLQIWFLSVLAYSLYNVLFIVYSETNCDKRHSANRLSMKMGRLSKLVPQLSKIQL